MVVNMTHVTLLGPISLLLTVVYTTVTQDIFLHFLAGNTLFSLMGDLLSTDSQFFSLARMGELPP